MPLVKYICSEISHKTIVFEIIAWAHLRNLAQYGYSPLLGSWHHEIPFFPCFDAWEDQSQTRSYLKVSQFDSNRPNGHHSSDEPLIGKFDMLNNVRFKAFIIR